MILVDLKGYKLYEAYYKVFPGRRHVKKKSASGQAGSIRKKYREEHWDDWLEQAARHECDPDRYWAGLDDLLKAETYDEVIQTKIIYPEKGGIQFKPVPVVSRNTVVVKNDGVRLGAVKELGDRLGIGVKKDGSNGGSTQPINIIIIGHVEKKPQERYVESGDDDRN